MVVIATFGAGSARAGKRISYENDVFTVDGHDSISVAAIMDCDAAGQLIWASEALRVWVGSLPRVRGKTARRPHRALLVIAAVVALVVLVAVVHAALAGSTSGSGGNKGTWVKVFTWSGGGAADDIRSSDPFALNGGRQRIRVASVAVGSDPTMISVGWTLNRVDASGGSRAIEPAGVGVSDLDLHLPAGYYYLSSDTVSCTWVVTISESR